MTSVPTPTTLSPAVQADLAALQLEIQAAKTGVFEDGVTALFSGFLGTTFAVAKSGTQHGTDASTAGRQGRKLLIECKRYRDTTRMDERSLRGEIDEAQERTPALEAWILAASRDVPDQVETGMYNSGLKDGVPVLVVDWKGTGVPALAALLAWDPATTEQHFGARAGALAKAIAPAMAAKIAELQRELEEWQIGFEVLRKNSLALLVKTRTDRHEANVTFNQVVKAPEFVRRLAPSSTMSKWWATPSQPGAPLCVIGNEGNGKTWATMDWLEQVEDQLPITLVVPSSAIGGLTKLTATGVSAFLGERLHELTKVRDAQHWKARVDKLLKRPATEGAAFVLVLDGVNQQPLFDWLTVLKVLQSEHFRGRVRVIVSARKAYFDNELRELKALVDKPDKALVERFTDAELDSMLGQHGIARTSMNAELLERAKTPRLFSLVMRLRDRLQDAGQITVHRLLYEHGRDTLGDRAWSDAEWRQWLGGVAERALEGITQYSRKELADQAHDFSMDESQVARRLSEIIDGQFTRAAKLGKYELEPVLVSHALGAALVEVLQAQPDVATADDLLGGWLESIAGLDQPAEVLRAAVSIALESGHTGPTLTLLVTAWLQMQNIAPAHRSELIALAPAMPVNLLEVVERSSRSAHGSARLTALAALRSLDRNDAGLRDLLVARATRWLSLVARYSFSNDESEKKRADQRLHERIGVVPGAHKTVLGVPLTLVDRDSDQWGASAAAVLEGLPLEHAIPAFVAGALSGLLSPMHAHWESLKWLCLLNPVDPRQTAIALRAASANVMALTPEAGVNPKLQQRLAAFLLYLTGYSSDRDAGAALDSDLDHQWDYKRDYLDRIGHSFFEVERRHASQVLDDASMDVVLRAHKLEQHWLDPAFVPTPEFSKELAELVADFPVDKLYINRYATTESHSFERILPALARCSPSALAQLWRSWAQAGLTKDADPRLWHGAHMNDALLIQGADELAAHRQMRVEAAAASDQIHYQVGNESLVGEMLVPDAFERSVAALDAGLPDLTRTVVELAGPFSTEQMDRLIARYGTAPDPVPRYLLEMFARHRTHPSNEAWEWIAQSLTSTDEDLARLAFSILDTADPAKLGARLLSIDWRWQAELEPAIGFHGSNAIVAATFGQSFDEVWPRLAPWWWLEAARLRGADPVEVSQAAGAFDAVIRADAAESFDAGAELTVWKPNKRSGPLGLSVHPLPEADADSPEGFARMFDDEARDAAFKNARKVAWERITAARRSASSLVMVDMTADEFDMVFRLAPKFIDRWIEGYDTRTEAFRRRVQLAEVPFLALCQVLLSRQPATGVAFWKALRETVQSRVLNGMNVPELLHLVFRAPDGPEVDALRDELLDLHAALSDQWMYELSLAAQWNGRRNWLDTVIARDAASDANWRQQRAIVLSGFLAFNELPVAGAWVDGPLDGLVAQLEQRAARERWREACARHWWREYWSNPDAEASYAAWVLFHECADRRAELWQDDEAAKVADTASPLYLRKRWHARANRKGFDAGLDRSSAWNQKKFLGRTIETDVWPWRP